MQSQNGRVHGTNSPLLFYRVGRATQDLIPLPLSPTWRGRDVTPRPAGEGGRGMRSCIPCKVINKPLTGFTFAELLATMLFVAIVVPVVVQGMTLANKAGVIADRKRIAGELADNLLTEWIATDEWREGQRSGDFGESWPEYRWVMADSEWEKDSEMRVLAVEVFFTAQGKEYSVMLTTLVEDSEDTSEEDTEESSGETSSS